MKKRESKSGGLKAPPIATIADVDLTYRAYLTGLSAAENKQRWSYGPEGQRLSKAHSQAQTAAVDAFARLNGWRRARWAGRSVEWLGRGSSYRADRWCGADPIFDHFEAFSVARRVVALVGQPYEGALRGRADEAIPALRALLAERGFILHVPPDPFASIHYPGSCLFLVVTLPNVSVVSWLPDQDGSWRAAVRPIQGVVS